MILATHPHVQVRHALSNDTVSLADLRRGQKACVVAVEAPGDQAEHLMEMAGLTPGTTVAVLQPSQWGHAMRLALRGGVLSLQGGHARTIRVQPL